MLNHYIIHNLPGLKHSQALCSCGYEEFNEKKEIKWQCPQCGSDCIKEFDTLTFGNQEYNRAFIIIKNLSTRKYHFTMMIGKLSGIVNTKFSKKKVEFKKDSLTSVQVEVIFDGSLPKNEMMKIIDCQTGDIINNHDHIFNFIKDNFHGVRNNILRRDCLTNACKLNLPHLTGAGDLPNVTTILSNMENLIEYCEKNEQLIKIGLDPHKLNGKIDYSKTNPTGQLGLSPYMVNVLKEKGENTHEALITIETLFKEQSINYMNTFANLSNGLNTYDIGRMATLVNNANLSIKKLYRFLYKDAPMQQGLYHPSSTLTLLSDSYEMAKSLEIPFDKNPKALERYHNILTREFKIASDAKKNAMFASAVSKFKDMELIEKVIEEPILTKEDIEKELTQISKKDKKQKYAIVLPKDANDLIREGKLQRHCVASYVDRVIREHTLIFFLRKADNLETPYATIEVCPNSKSIRQIKCKANQKLKESDANKFIEKWCEKKDIHWNGAW